MLQFLWLFFHVTRLLLIVEPCHTASVEVRRELVLALLCVLIDIVGDWWVGVKWVVPGELVAGYGLVSWSRHNLCTNTKYSV